MSHMPTLTVAYERRCRNAGRTDVTYACRQGDCHDCSGGYHKPATIAGRRHYSWFHECRCSCHDEQ